MLRLSSQPGQILIGLVLIVLAIVVAWAAASYFISVFLLANPSVQASIIAAIAAIVSLTVTAWRERSRSIREAHRESKISVYSEFHDVIFQAMNSAREKPIDLNISEEPDSEVVKKLMKVSQGALFYGSPKVILALGAWMKSSATSTDPLLAIRAIGRILLAMREDIGLSNRGLDEISIHQLYVRDDLRTLGAK